MEAVWTDYAAAKPAPESVCEWRMPHSTLEGVVVVVIAKMRQRGAGYSDTYSPPFDYWDGYRLHVPKGLQWRALAEPKVLKSHDVELVGVEGLTHCECIYCGKVPKLKGYRRYPGGGCGVNPAPNELNSWSLVCCGWGRTPDLDDPRKLEETRRAAFARAAHTAPAQPSAEQVASEAAVRDAALADAEEACVNVEQAADDNSETSVAMGAIRCFRAIHKLRTTASGEKGDTNA